MAVSGGCLQAQGFEEVELLRLLAREGCLGCRADTSDVLLNALKQIEGGPRACTVAFRLQAHAHDAVENEGYPTLTLGAGILAEFAG